MSNIEKGRRRLPPYSEEGERAILGSILIEPSRVIDLCISKNVTSDSFYIPAHRLIYENLMAMNRFGIIVDLVSCGEYFKKAGALDAIGGYHALEGLIDCTPTSAHAEYYIEIIQKKHALRQWITLAAEITDMAFQEELDEIENQIDTSSTKIFQILSADQLVTNTISNSVERLRGNIRLRCPVIRKIPSSINTIRQRIVGYPIGRMTVIASRPGVGKTALACTETLYTAKTGTKCSVLTFEMTADEYTARMGCIEAQVDLEKYIDGKLTDEEIDRLDGALEMINGLPIHICDRAMNIRQVTRWIKKESKWTEMVIVDHFLLIKHMSKKGERESSIYGEWSRVLSETTKNCNIALLLLAQLRRFNPYGIKGQPTPPTKNDLKETGCLEEDAYLLLLIHDQEIKDVSDYQIIVDKHRNGWHGTVPANFVKAYAKITGLGEER